MRLVFLGAPGAGKGTQAKVYSKNRGVPHISTGDIFRNTIQHGGEKAEELKFYMDAGKLVPNSIVLEMVAVRLSKEDCQKGFVLDGFPRNVDQAAALDRLLEGREIPLDGVVFLDIPQDLLVDRLTSRRVCSNKECQTPYNLKFKAPAKEGLCDLCGHELLHRKDDHPEVILQRFEEYTKQTEPLVAYYQQKGLLFKIEARGTIDSVYKTMEIALAELGV